MAFVIFAIGKILLAYVCHMMYVCLLVLYEKMCFIFVLYVINHQPENDQIDVCQRVSMIELMIIW